MASGHQPPTSELVFNFLSPLFSSLDLSSSPVFHLLLSFIFSLLSSLRFSSLSFVLSCLLSLSSFSVSHCLSPSLSPCVVLCVVAWCCVVVVWLLCCVVWCGVWHAEIKPSVCRFKTSPCVPAPRAHVLPHAGVVLVHTGAF